MAEQYSNNATTTLSGAMDGVTNPVVFNVTDAAAFPSGGNFRVVIDVETLRVTARAGNQFTADRAQEGSAIAAHSSGATVAHVLTAQGLRELVNDHKADADPHTGYATDTDISGHVAAADPHTVYERETQKGIAGGYASLDNPGATVPDAQIPAAIARDSEVTTQVSTHAQASDPHTGYQRESEKSQIGGYPTLVDIGGAPVTPASQLGTGTPDASKVLRGDNSWAVVATVKPTITSFGFDGQLAVVTGTHRWYADQAYNLTKVISSVGTAPTGADIRLGINLDGVQIGTNAQRPKILVSTFVEFKTTGFLPAAIPANSYLSVDVEVIGSTIPGSDLTCQLVLEPST